jgi:protein-S-isoprenylcysteine O-methyltransferase Ste14
MIAMAGYALLTNYLAVYILAAASPLILLLVVQLEEKELRDRFGKQYEDYCVRVPRFIPRRWRIR